MNNIKKNLTLWLIIFLFFFSIYQGYKYININNIKNISYSTFITKLNKNKIKSINLNENKMLITNKNNKNYIVFIPKNNFKLINILLNKNIKFSVIHSENLNFFTSFFVSWFPILLLIIIWSFFVKQIYKNNKGTINFGKNKARIFKEIKNKVTFNDIAGCDEAKNEIKELIVFLLKPNKLKKLGGKIPKGILMIGPPGTGKTMLAKAIATEAKMTFFNISGSDFIEMFVGVGASRIRNMFIEAKKNLPCIIFIDEIDAIGRNRNSGINNNGHDEREQTLNQLLVEMDGFEEHENIIIIAATNRSDILDPALLRPGRFDKHIIIDLPDIIGRTQILNTHIKNIPLNKDINTSIIARGTPGFSGADLSNLINEAIFYAVKFNKKNISMIDFEKAKDKILIGLEKKSMFLNHNQKKYIAYHEAGHALISYLVPEHDPIHKITIIPRGNSLGITYFLPKNDYINYSKEKLESKISTLYGGRIAEEIIYGKKKISTGSYNDIKTATIIAKNMITKWGFSEKIEPLLYIDEKNEFKSNRLNNISNKTLEFIDMEVKFIINRNYKRSKFLLIKNIDILHIIQNYLIKHETINSVKIKNLMKRIILK